MKLLEIIKKILIVIILAPALLIYGLVNTK